MLILTCSATDPLSRAMVELVQKFRLFWSSVIELRGLVKLNGLKKCLYLRNDLCKLVRDDGRSRMFYIII